MWEAIRRTSFSTIVSAILDYGCAILDAQGNQLVNPANSMPVFGLALPRLARDLLRRFDGRVYQGDIFIGNDPWLCCGHLPDVAVITPVFQRDRLVAFTASIAHQADLGGIHGANRVREVYEEGLFLPVMKLYECGRRDETLFSILRGNVRVPDLVLGDLEAQVAANETGARHLLALLGEYEREYGVDDPSALVNELQDRSERAMREVIRALPDGTYRAEGWADSKGNPTKLVVAVTVAGEEISVDFTGTSDQLESGGVNCTLAYTIGETHYAIKCILAPDIPHNEGSTRPIRVTAPEGSILNCTFPSAVNARLWTGLHVYPTLQAALARIVPTRAQASNGLYTFPRVVGSYPSGKGYNATIMAGGGQGGSAARDGMGGYLFPIACSGVSIEVFENACPAMITEKEWLPDTAGAGRHRGGPAARVGVRRLPGYPLPVRMFYTPIRGSVAAPGMFGGRDGTLDVPVWNGSPLPADSPMRRDGWVMFRADSDQLIFHAPSGAGFGDPSERDPAAIAEDIGSGLVTSAGAARDYGPSRPPTER